MHREYGSARGCFHLNVSVALHGRKLLGYQSRGRIDAVEILAEHIHDDARGLPRDRFTDAVAEKSEHLALNPREFTEHFAQLGLHFHLFRRADAALELDVELTLVWPPRVFSSL